MSALTTSFRTIQPSIGLAINWLKDMRHATGIPRILTQNLIHQSFAATSYHFPIESGENITGEDKDSLITALYDTDPQTIIASASIIGELGSKGKFALYDLVYILDNLNPDVKIAGCKAIGKIGSPDAIDALPALTRTLNKVDNDRVKIAASNAIGKFGVDAVDAVPALSQTLTSKNNGVIIAAANALSKIGPGAKDAVPDLITAFGTNNNGVKIAVSNALGKIGPDARDAFFVLVKALNHANNTVAKYIGIAIREINPWFSNS